MNKIILGLLLAFCAPSYAGIDPGPIDLPLAVSSGGSGVTTASAAFNIFSPMTTAGDMIYGGASGAGTRLAIGTNGQCMLVSAGAPAWGSCGGGGTPGGSDTQVQYNSSGSFAGSSNFTWDNTNQRLRIKSANSGGAIGRLDVGVTSSEDAVVFSTRNNDVGSGQFGWDFHHDGVTTGNFYIQSISNPTAVTKFTIKRDSDEIVIRNLLTLSGTSSGTVGLKAAAAAGSSIFTLPAADGTNGQFLKTNGSGVLSFAGAIASPAGSDTQIQYNAAGVMGANSNFSFDYTNAVFHVGTGQDLGSLGSPYMHFQGSTLYPPSVGAGQVIIQGNDTSNAVNTGGSLVFAGNRNGASTFSPWAALAGLKENSTANDDHGYLGFYTRTPGTVAEKMRISSDGSLGIGVTSPTAQLHTSGTVRFANYGAGSAVFDSSGNISSVASEYTKVTKTFTNFSTAANSNSITLFTLPAATLIKDMIIRPTVAFTGGSISAYTISVGISGNNAKYASAYDMLSAITGTRFQVSNSTDMENFGSSTAITVTATSTGDTLNHAAAGSVDIYYSLKGLP